MANNNKPVKEKRRPGRPPTKKKEVSIQLMGIAQQPANPDNIFEMTYCNPITFKNVYSLFKNYNATVIRMNLRRGGITFISQSQSEVTPIFVYVNGYRVHHYYCGAEIDIYLKIDQFYDAFNSIDKKGTYVAKFIITNDNREVLHVRVEDKSAEFDHNYEFELIHHDETIAAIDIGAYRENDYPLAWKTSAAQYKRIIQHAGSADGFVRFQKDGGANKNITVSFEKGRRTSYTGEFKSNRKIELRDEIPANECLNISLYSKNITGFTKSTLGDIISLYADTANPFCMKTEMDYNLRYDEPTNAVAKPAFIVRVFVPLVN